MKYLLVLFIVLVGIWLWRANRPSAPTSNRPPTTPAPEPLDMVRCAQCSIHVPAVDALQGKDGVYCCADHLQRAER